MTVKFKNKEIKNKSFLNRDGEEGNYFLKIIKT